MKTFFYHPTIGQYGFNMLLMLLMTASILVGCEKPNRSAALTSGQLVKKYDQATMLQGLVSNKDGTIKAGSVEAADQNDRLIAQAVVQDNGRYHLQIPANTSLPVVLTFYSPQDAATQQKLIAVAVDPSITQYDLNALTTAIANKAKALGGYTRTNMVVAAESTISAPEANKTSTGFRGDPTQQYGGWH